MAPSNSLSSPEFVFAIYYYSCCLFSDLSVLNMKTFLIYYYLLPVANEVSVRLALVVS